MDPTLFITVKGGVVQGARVMNMPMDIDVVVLDFDDEELDADGVVYRHTPFGTWDQLVEKTDAVY